MAADAGEEADDGCTDTEEAHAEEVDAESVGRRVQPVVRVPHRPGKWRRVALVLLHVGGAVCCGYSAWMS